ncbi:MAG: ABC transporter ATP-binding protein, partial [Candidatus Binatia bacterium]
MIEVQNVTKYYGQVRALNQVSFSIKKGEIVGLLGPNGSGKTTLMRILTGFFQPTEGSVVVAGHDVQTASLEVRRRLGYLPENVVLYPDMSVRSFLEFCARVKALTPAQRPQQVERVLTECGLGHMAHRHIGTLSKGYRQRVGLAQALLCDPEVLILDEPTIGLDPLQLVDIRELIKGLGGRTTIL